MVQNSLAKKSEETATVKYEVNGQEIKLSPTIIRKYLVSGQGTVSDQEIMMFLSMCKFQKLNPFLREAYLIKYGDNDPATMVTGKEVFTKRASRAKNYDGDESGIIVLDKDGIPVERYGTFRLPTEIIVGGWAHVYLKDIKVPKKISVSFDEYVGKKKDGTPNAQWSKKPATMIRKVALVQALREAFPEELQGLYAPEEMGVEESALSEEPIQQPTEKSEPIIVEIVENEPDILG